MAENLGASFSIDIGNLKAGLAEANRLIRQSNSEFLTAAAGMDDWTKSSDGLAAKSKNLLTVIDLQSQKVDALVAQKNDLIKTMTAEGKSADEISRAVDGVNKQIERESKALIKLKAELDKNEKAMAELDNTADDTSDSIDETSGSFEKLSKVGGAVGGVIKGLAGAVAGAVTSFFALAESTRETRTQLSKVETQFETTGKTAEQAMDTYNGLYAVLGDSDRATEASGNLAQLAKSQKDLTDWTTIATGVYATFGDGLPIESLTEASNETAKVGTVTGTLADALNWVGVSEDDFNKKLAACSSEQERAQLITSTLTGLYSDAAKQYTETAADIIAANDAQNQLNQSMAGLGAVAEPVMTTFKLMGADILSSITPSVDLIGQGLTGALSGADGAAEKLGQGIGGVFTSLIESVTSILPTVTSAFSTLIPTLLDSLTAALPAVLDAGVQILNSLLTGILSAAPSLISTAGSLIVQLCSTLSVLLPQIVQTVVDMTPSLLQAIMDALPQIILAISSMVTSIVQQLPFIINSLIAELPKLVEITISTLLGCLPQLLSAAIELFMALVQAIPKIIPQLVAALPDILWAIIKGLSTGISQMGTVGKDLVEGLWNGIKDMGSWVLEKVKGFGQSIVDGLKSFFGIHSPSKLLEKEVGKNLALGIGRGFTDKMGAVSKQIVKSTAGLSPEIGMTVGAAGRGSGATVTVNQYNTYASAHTRYELYKSKQQTAAAVRLALAGVG